ncbi:hypothetical protein QLX67_04945, partial [Balneolaceae bacterium ANBcel3]|nr:hypothetical protein [Balneolaceae bacterium ANBcel3]
MSDLTHHIRQYVAPSDWLIIMGGIFLFLFLKWVTWALGVPPLEWVALGGAGVVFFLIRSIQYPLLLLVLIAVGSLLGNLILVFEGGLIPFSLFQIFYLFSIGVFILRWFLLGFTPIKKTGFELELALFFGLIFLSILWTPDAERAFWHAMRMLTLSGLLFLLVNWIESPRQISLLILSLIAVGMVLGLLAVYHTINNPMAIL